MVNLEVGLPYRYSSVVKLVKELHHLSQGGVQGELLSDEVSKWASP